MSRPDPADLLVMLLLPPAVWLLNLAAEVVMGVARTLDERREK